MSQAIQKAKAKEPYDSTGAVLTLREIAPSVYMWVKASR
jgi:hypothetical protein